MGKSKSLKRGKQQTPSQNKSKPVLGTIPGFFDRPDHSRSKPRAQVQAASSPSHDEEDDHVSSPSRVSDTASLALSPSATEGLDPQSPAPAEDRTEDQYELQGAREWPCAKSSGASAPTFPQGAPQQAVFQVTQQSEARSPLSQGSPGPAALQDTEWPILIGVQGLPQRPSRRRNPSIPDGPAFRPQASRPQTSQSTYVHNSALMDTVPEIPGSISTPDHCSPIISGDTLPLLSDSTCTLLTPTAAAHPSDRQAIHNFIQNMPTKADFQQLLMEVRDACKSEICSLRTDLQQMSQRIDDIDEEIQSVKMDVHTVRSMYATRRVSYVIYKGK